jgi:hypothetical protein
MFILTPLELKVVDALSNGATLTDAAAQAGIHRNTIANWRLNSPEFREALALARYDRAVLYNDRAVDLADLAFETLRILLTDPKSSPSVRLRAAIFIIDKAVALPEPNQENTAPMVDLDRFAPQPPPDAQNCTTVHNDPQSQPEPEPEPASPMHNSAQSPETYRRSEPKIGRNDPCRCGSGKKYKRCCLGNASAAAA